ncbi:hypothetical protein GH714_022546 [Hevea brasiliensis]|uniref:Carbohydrate-binding-like fold protein n=1 Tax=Hevea brasiliensis TaxID=3981 RepID=A0A6A6NIN0_HEVBR|nr:hypothetical protein GH714_022546 [Hevea brasiliensis]
MKIRDAWIYFLMLIFSFSVASADSIHGCGGFVEASSSLIKSRKSTDAKLDYSRVTVELRTLDGLVKDRTQCAPNGYYFIPVYDKGSFVIKINGPEGWSWDPENVPVVVDDTGCNSNEDINFRFTGVGGGESCSVKNGGPSNVNVELLSPSDDLISSAVTSPTGSYLFTNIIPGKYKIRASHPDLKIEVKGSTEVELGFENGIVDDIFFVPGYDLHGYVVAQGNPILGVHIYLYSDDVVEVVCPQGYGDSMRQRKPLCHAVSDADGMFTFKSIPCARYELLPFYKGENTVFDVSPPVVLVSVEHQHVTVPQKFQVTGFLLEGEWFDGNAMGVEGVKIIVDGRERFCQIWLQWQIKAVSYDVCGVVRMVTLTHGPENVKPQVIQTDGSGNFCFEVPPGEYRLSAFAATPESAPGLLFLPPYIDVMVQSPLLDVEFSQALVNVLGSVTCKERCGSSVSVSLVRLPGNHNEERKSISLTDESDEFLFPNVLPGKYRLEVKHNSPDAMRSEDNWCWERSFIDVDVGAEDVKGIVFIQKGYWVNVISTHDVDAYMAQPDSSIINLKIKKGSQRICVESPAYLSERGEKYLLKGQIKVKLSSADGAFELPNNIIVDIINSAGSVIDATSANLASSGSDQNKHWFPGYHLKRVGPYSFSCQKLGQISVHIYSEGDASEPIPLVLLSLSGDDGYRNNSISGAGGTFLFDNLFPGIFYLRPLFKEYAFSPPAQAIELGSGDSREVAFQATRVAYSATGAITLLSGQPKEGVAVEARSESKGYYEETVTDSSGNYRLRGLIPDTEYVIKVVEKHGLGTPRIERASPESITVKVGFEDIRGLNFIVFEQPEMTILSCHVEGKRMGEFHSHLLVEIKSASDTSKIESVFPLPLSNFFQVKNLPKGKHLLQLRSSLKSSNLKFESDVIEVDLDKTAQIHVGPLRYNFEEDHHKQELTAAPVFPLVVGISVIALFISMPRLKDLYQATTGIPAPGFMTTAKKEPRKSAVRKKTY